MQMRKTEIQNSISIGRSSLQDRETATRNSVRRAADLVPLKVPVYREGNRSCLESQFPNGTLQEACHLYAGRRRAPTPRSPKKIFLRARNVGQPPNAYTPDTLEPSLRGGAKPWAA